MSEPPLSLLRLSFEQLDTKKHLLQCLARERLMRSLLLTNSHSQSVRERLTQVAQRLRDFFEAEYCLILRWATHRTDSMEGCPVELIIQDGDDYLNYIGLESFSPAMVGCLSDATASEVSSLLGKLIGTQSGVAVQIHNEGACQGIVYLGHFYRGRVWMPMEQAILQEATLPIANIFFQSDLILQNRLALAEVKILSQRKSQNLACISHELRTPLHNVMAGLELLNRDHFGKHSPLQSKALCRLKQNTQYLLHLVNQLLDSAVIEAGQVQLEMKPTSITRLLNDTVAMVHNIYDAAGQHIDIQIAKDVPAAIVCDPLRVQQILCNFLVNAHRFNNPARAVILTASCDGSQLELSVRDFGSGLHPEDQARIFNAYESLADKPGTGLGLFIAKSLAEAHHGKVSVRSTPGVGSEFVFSLPLVPQ